MPSDQSFKSIKEIMLGKAYLHPDFRMLADFIDQQFGVKTINIIYDTFSKFELPRLNICFETEQEKQSFDYDRQHSNFDSQKQKIIAEKFGEILIENNCTKYETNNILISYSAFEPISKMETIEAIPQEQIEKLKTALDSDELWEISRAFSKITFFLYTDDQVRKHQKSPQRKEWANKFFDLIEPYNEFGYFKRDKFDIYLDSKGNFDKNYQSNWYYYYK